MLCCFQVKVLGKEQLVPWPDVGAAWARRGRLGAQSLCRGSLLLTPESPTSVQTSSTIAETVEVHVDLKDLRVKTTGDAHRGQHFGRQGIPSYGQKTGLQQRV